MARTTVRDEANEGDPCPKPLLYIVDRLKPVVGLGKGLMTGARALLKGPKIANSMSGSEYLNRLRSRAEGAIATGGLGGGIP